MTDELVTRLRNQLEFWNSGGRFEAADRIEADAATIARLTEQSAMWKESAENYRWAAREALDAAKEILADRKAAEAKLAQAVEVLRGFVTTYGKAYHGASQGDARQAQMDALAKQADRARAFLDSMGGK